MITTGRSSLPAAIATNAPRDDDDDDDAAPFRPTTLLPIIPNKDADADANLLPLFLLNPSLHTAEGPRRRAEEDEITNIVVAVVVVVMVVIVVVVVVVVFCT